MKKYNPDQYDRSAFVPFYDEVSLWSAPFGLRLLETIRYRKGIKALDIGFGAGFPLTEIAMRLGETSTVYGIDPWKAATERAKEKLSFYGIENVIILDGVAESIPLPDQSIDLLISNNGLNNVNDLPKSLSECSRVLKEGGQMVITLNTDKSMLEFYNVLEEVLLERQMHDEVKKMQRHIYTKRRPEEEWLVLLQESGFTVNSIIPHQFEYRFADATAMFNHYFIRLAFMDSWTKLLPGDKAEDIFGVVESRLNTAAAEQGGMKLSVPFVVIDCSK